MKNDPVLDELKALRLEHAKAFGNDLRAMYDDLKRDEQDVKPRLVSRRPRRPAERLTRASADGNA